MNLHVAYRAAPPYVLDAFATIVRTGGVATAASQRAGGVVLEWPELTRALEELRTHRRPRTVAQRCCGTEAQQEYLRALYRYFNETRFDATLPHDIPLRFSSRMRSSLGHMMPGRHRNGHRYVVEIALNVDLLLAGNGAERVDTLLHEMAHAADYLRSGEHGHGASWRAWAKSVGCRPTTLYDRPVRRRRSRRTVVTRVPPLPRALRGRKVA
ncbi:MAG: SprT family zinc-dependent metalloprotease [Gemmatimonadota bacterium]